MSDLLLTLLAMNLAAAAAIVVALLLRRPVRKLFGPRIAYGLWSLAPLAALAILAPARVIRVPAEAPVPDPPTPPGLEAAFPSSGAVAAHVDRADQLWGLAVDVWVVGCLLSLAYLIWRQARFAAAARAGIAGPAVVGVIRPRVIAPADFTDRYTPREQVVVMAHEETHIRRHDSRVNALVALACCVNWFNPLVHLLARYLRIDQELACDAQVVAAHPKARKAYAEAMLKAQLAARPLPLGCYWPAESQHPLAERIRLLGQPGPDPLQHIMGGFLVAITATAIAYAAWAAKPARFAPVLNEVAHAVAPAPRAIAEAAGVRVDHAPPALRARPAPAPPYPVDPASSSAADDPDAVDTTLTQPLIARAAEVDRQRQDLDVVSGRLATYRMALVSRSPNGEVVISPAIEPGKAIEMWALLRAPDGRQVRSHQTSFGSQGGYRRGTYEENGSRYALRTRVTQKGDSVEVYARMLHRGRTVSAGALTLTSGDTGDLVMTNGQVVTVSAAIRPETDAEVERGERAMARIRPKLEALYARPWEAYERSCASGLAGC